MTRPDLSRLTLEEKDALILALLDRIAALEARIGEPPKTLDNSNLPPSRGPKANRPPQPKRAHRKRKGPGVVTRVCAATPDLSVACHAERCLHCGLALAGQSYGRPITVTASQAIGTALSGTVSFQT